MKPLIVMKFGGTSVGDAARIQRVADIVGEYDDYRIVVVVSALSGTTDQLVQAFNRASQGDNWDEHLSQLEAAHYAVLSDLAGNATEKAATRQQLASLFAALRTQLSTIQPNASRQAYDGIVSFGERLSVRLVAYCLNHSNLAAEAVEATNLIETTDTFGDAEPLLDKTETRVRHYLWPLVQRDTIPVVTGFIGATSQGVTTTLGRGASDYTATILGYSLAADEVIIWTDVSGVMTSDPRIIPEARSIQSLSYEEAAELSHFGAKVLHPLTIVPAALKNIPIQIKNSFRTEAAGTLISNTATLRPGIKAITPKRQLSLITIDAAQASFDELFRAVQESLVDTHTTNYLLTHASAFTSMLLTVDAARAENFSTQLTTRIAAIAPTSTVVTVPDIAILAIVGDSVYSTPGLYAAIFTALSTMGIRLHAIATDTRKRSLSVVIDEKDIDLAIRGLHQALHLLDTNGMEQTVE